MFLDWSCGGEWNYMLEFLSTFFNTLQQANIHTAIFMNGALEPDRSVPQTSELKTAMPVEIGLKTSVHFPFFNGIWDEICAFIIWLFFKGSLKNSVECHYNFARVQVENRKIWVCCKMFFLLGKSLAVFILKLLILGILKHMFWVIN